MTFVHRPVAVNPRVMASRRKPQERCMANVRPVATAPPSGTVLDSAADAVLLTAASRRRSPGRPTQIGGQFDTRFTTPNSTANTQVAVVIDAVALAALSPPMSFGIRNTKMATTTP